jgi:cytochrome c-type biogenesis protein CcmH
MRPLFLRVTVAALLAWAFVGPAHADVARHVEAAQDASFNEYVPGASRLEGRLLAPCCWDASRQTLDIHGSPIANELRREIRHRLKAGEAPDAIEADLVARYTTKILAVPPDSPLPRMGTFLLFGLLGVGSLALRMVFRWRRQSREAQLGAQPVVASGVPDEWDDRLNAELEERD